VRSKVLTLTAGLLSLAVMAQPELNIQVRGSAVDIRAQRVPLQQVLDNLSQKTGMKVIYDTEPPQEIVTLDLRDMGMRGALMQLLQGHGLTYAVRMDPTGTRVETLLLTHGGGGALKAAPPPPPQMMMQEQAEQQEYYEEMAEPNEPPPPPEPTPPPTPTPAAFWTPAPFPQGIPGIQMGGPPQSTPGHIEQVPPSLEGQPPPEGMPPPPG
jgi:hypothetical protein